MRSMRSTKRSTTKLKPRPAVLLLPPCHVPCGHALFCEWLPLFHLQVKRRTRVRAVSDSSWKA